MRSLCLGGSFNPVHVGHIRLGDTSARAGGFDRVILIPSGDPPHKQRASDLAPAADRARMCALATADRPTFTVNRLEIDRPGRSYTIDTAQQLLAQGLPEVHWLIGADWLAGLPTWHRWDELRHLVQFWVVRRPGYQIEWAKLDPTVETLQNRVLEVPEIDISSSDIRARVRAGRSIAGMVHPDVETYIQTRRLYQEST